MLDWQPYSWLAPSLTTSLDIAATMDGLKGDIKDRRPEPSKKQSVADLTMYALTLAP